jgi:hypothetical protein
MLTSEEYIKKANVIHNNFYDYSIINYKNMLSNIIIICPIHGPFTQRPDVHLRGSGCKKCASDRIKLSDNDIIKRLNKINKKRYNNKYKFGNIIHEYLKKTKIEIICPIHGLFVKRLDHFLNGYDCKKCKGFNILNKEDFVKKVNEIYSNKYDYTLFNYINTITKGIIKCPIHGDFLSTPNNHLSGHGCKKCQYDILETSDFNKKANIIHNNFYDYSLVNYINSRTKVKIICPKHGVFEQTPDNHISKKQGCPYCNESKGEKEIKRILDELNIEYEQQYKLYEEKKKHPLMGDFYLSKYNIIIEYNGIQHYEPVELFGGLKNFNNIIDRDERKKNLCVLMNIKLLIITYKEFNNIKNIILKILF